MSTTKINPYGLYGVLLLVIFILVFANHDKIKERIQEHQQIQQPIVIDNSKELEDLKKKVDAQQEEIKKLKKAVAQKTSFQNEVACIADNVYYEARTEPYEGQVAVAQVTVNRMHSGLYPRTACGVVHQYAQFSWTLPKIYNTLNHHKNPAQYKQCLAIAKAVLTNKEKSDIIDSDVILFHGTYIDPPKWATSGKNEQVGIIGKHVFYKRSES